MTTKSLSTTPLESLQSFGLDERTAKLYLSLLELGEASVLQLAKKSGVERTVIYYLLKDLRRLQLVREVYDENDRVRLQPAPPKRLLQIEDERHNRIKNTLPELEALYQATPTQPKIRIFHGLSGVDELYDDVITTLSALPKQQREVLTCSSIDLLTALNIRNQAPFREKRRQHEIRLRVIGNATETGQYFADRDEVELRESRLLPKSHPLFAATLIIYANKVAQYNIMGDISVLLIENTDLANTQRYIFELAWAEAGRIDNLSTPKY